MRTLRFTRSADWIPLWFGFVSAAIAVVPEGRMKLALAIPIVAAGMIWWSLLAAHRWLIAFFLCALLTPPLALPGFDSGVQLAPIFVLIGLASGVVRLPDWTKPPRALSMAFVAFLMALVVSGAFGALYSGAEAGLGSLARIALFAIGVFVFFYACSGPRETTSDPLKLAAFLFLVGVAGALFACADFYFHFPAPQGFEPQFVWLDEGVFRRAQGLFYESSTLGNFCSFFVVMVVVAASRGARNFPLPYLVLAVGGIGIAAALILSYSRGSLVNLIVACVALAALRRVSVWRVAMLAAIAAALAIVAVQAIWPSFSASYWTRIAGSLQYFWYSPNGVLSGRIVNWNLLIDFFLREPWRCLFGIGYKTLPYSGLTGIPLIADNTYLDLLVETGVVGLASFLTLNVCILKSSLRAARASHTRGVFWGEWMFCFWTGEMVQMLSGDLITYWRVLPLYFWVLGTAVREIRVNA